MAIGWKHSHYWEEQIVVEVVPVVEMTFAVQERLLTAAMVAREAAFTNFKVRRMTFEIRYLEG